MKLFDCESIPMSNNTKPIPYMKFCFEVEWFKVYQTNFNEDIYILFDSNKKLYSALKYSGKREDSKRNITSLINGIFLLPERKNIAKI